jgi:hypothetical protein
MSNLVWQKFGRLTILEKCKKPPKYYRSKWLCECECGLRREVYEQNLISGKTLSCGCLNYDILWKGHGEISGNYWHRLELDAKRRELFWDLNIEYGWEIFLKQEKKCVLSGVELRFGTKYLNYKYKQDQTASLDRIDPSGAYTVGNVQWVHKNINVMKMSMKEDEFIKWCNLVVNSYAGRFRSHAGHDPMYSDNYDMPYDAGPGGY